MDRRHDRPGRFDLVGAGEQRLIPEHGVEDQRLVGLGRVRRERRAVREVHRDRADGKTKARHLRPEAEQDALVGLDADRQEVRLRVGRRPGEQAMRHLAELDRDLGRPLGHPLAGPQVERHAGPAPVVDLEPSGDEGLRFGLFVHLGLRAVGRHGIPGHPPCPVLAPHDVSVDVRLRRRRDRPEDLQLLVAEGVRGECRRRLHRDEAHQLEQVVLEDVAGRAGLLVERAAVLDAERLGDRDLHVVDVPAVPERLEDPVAEPEDHQVPDRLLAEVVVDPVDLRLAEHPQHLAVQLLCRVEVATEGLLDDDPTPAPAVDLVIHPAPADLGDDLRERRRLRREIEQDVCLGALLDVHALDPRRQGVVARAVAEVAAVVGDALQELALHVRAQRDAAVLLERGRDVGAEALVIERPTPDRDERPVGRQEVGAPQLRERREDLAMRQVAGRSEQHRDVRVRNPLEPQPLAQRVDLGLRRGASALPAEREPLLPDGSRGRCRGRSRRGRRAHRRRPAWRDSLWPLSRPRWRCLSRPRRRPRYLSGTDSEGPRSISYLSGTVAPRFVAVARPDGPGSALAVPVRHRFDATTREPVPARYQSAPGHGSDYLSSSLLRGRRTRCGVRRAPSRRRNRPGASGTGSAGRG